MKQKNDNILKTTIILSALMLVSKLFGFIREMVLANFYGTSFVVDAFVMANSIPNILFGGLIAAVATAYMPIFSRTVEKYGIEAGNIFTSELINLLSLISVAIIAVGLLFSDSLVAIFASGFKGEVAELTSFFLKITTCYVFFNAVIGIFESYLQYTGDFYKQTITYYLQNIIVIAVVFISSSTSYKLLPFGLLIGYAIRMTVDYLIIKNKGYVYTTSFKMNAVIKEIIVISLPVFVSSTIASLNAFVDKTIGSVLPVGSVSSLNYSILIITLITGLTVTVLSTVFYPKLNKAISNSDYNKFNNMTEMGIDLIVLICVPATLGAMLYSKQLVQIIYERGTFDSAATIMTSSAFFYYSMGIVSIGLNEFFMRIYYSLKNTKLPMICSIIGIVINIILNLILMQFMAHRGLALSTSISSLVTCALLYLGLKKYYKEIVLFKSKSKILKIVISSFVAVAISYLAYTFVCKFIAIRLVQLMFAVIVAIICYLSLLLLFRVDIKKYLGGFSD